MSRMPIDTPQRRIGSRAVAIVHYAIDTEHWEFRQETGNDVGRDCTIELSENDKWLNHKVEGQIKGTTKIKCLRDQKTITFPIETKTINYALGSPIPFILFYVDVKNEIVYFLPIQDYFIANKHLFKKLEDNQVKMTLHIPNKNTLSNNDEMLVSIAKNTYLDGPGDALKKYTSQ